MQPATKIYALWASAVVKNGLWTFKNRRRVCVDQLNALWSAWLLMVLYLLFIFWQKCWSNRNNKLCSISKTKYFSAWITNYKYHSFSILSVLEKRGSHLFLQYCGKKPSVFEIFCFLKLLVQYYLLWPNTSKYFKLQYF
jgi:hypothetical protein